MALELSITWINRILFLKLLEAQLMKYHKGDKSYSFLNPSKIKNYDDLNRLFFQVLACKYDLRNEDVKKAFEKVPYLNSSLFEPTDIEQATLFISGLNDKTIPIFSQTVLKNQQGKKRSGSIPALEYLLEFLNAYDFSSEGSDEIQEDNKKLINASVLGLIFEKINGYKDGSFFTPGFITMYMCRETIRKAVVQKFNEVKKWNCNSIEELYDKIEDRKEANQIVNSIKICDPAVGSGHFLVSALNEMIAVKNDLKILQDREGKRLKEYHVEVVNDELAVTDEDGDPFEYVPGSKEKQRIQETLFHEKQTIIENCLFGVDINPNSVKICRLRLWIELLKNAYYKNATELETLPNIDINIKCGNSLISRFAIDADLKQALKKSKWTIDSYRLAVDTYRNAESKEQKWEMERLIADIKSDFRSEIETPFIRKISDARGKAENLSTRMLNLKSFGEKIDKKLLDDHRKAVEKLTQLETEREEIKASKIFENAFEWRFEFPEVLNDDGDFVGFDVIIGNPPYILVQSLGDQNIFNYYSQNYTTAKYKIDTYALFYELGIKLLSVNSTLCYITPNTFLKNKHSRELRHLILSNSLIKIVNFYTQVFEDASVDTLILMLSKTEEITANNKFAFSAYRNNVYDLFDTEKVYHFQNNFIKGNFELELDIDTSLRKLLTKIEHETKPLSFYGRSYFGIQTFDRKKFVSKVKLDESYYPVIDGGNVKRYRIEPNTEFVQFKKESIKSGGEASVYKKHRIVVRQIGVFPEGTIVEPNIMTLNTIYNVYLHNDDIDNLRFLLSLINSKLFHFYWFKKHYDNKATFPKIKKEPIESLPIKEADKEAIEKNSNLVEEILRKKTQDPTADTTDLENQIDQLVYQLYDLTEEEIKIIESA
ncbi:MAG TPA: TaqI-like C-terminal specificity domain-containing protein [Niabella sp.]|nr:TaqI-like C-terminal specificity domain-containing protein [Niabella sp.]